MSKLLFRKDLNFIVTVEKNINIHYICTTLHYTSLFDYSVVRKIY